MFFQTIKMYNGSYMLPTIFFMFDFVSILTPFLHRINLIYLIHFDFHRINFLKKNEGFFFLFFLVICNLISKCVCSRLTDTDMPIDVYNTMNKLYRIFIKSICTIDSIHFEKGRKHEILHNIN